MKLIIAIEDCHINTLNELLKNVKEMIQQHNLEDCTVEVKLIPAVEF